MYIRHPKTYYPAMSFRTYAVVFLAAFAGSFFLASCLNEDNKIPPNCYDGIRNNGELLVDCGGPCEECDHCINGIWEPWLGEICADCGGECPACPQCRNCVQDGDEVGIDCGGTFCGSCADLCDDGIPNGLEELVDCGGVCEACPTCIDDVMNGDEIGVDCGGTECPPCTTDGNCTNLIIDGNEYWVDCGGSICPGCDTILSFKLNGITQTVLANDVSFFFDGTVYNVSGTTLNGGQIALISDEPPAGWEEGTSVTMNQLTFPFRQISFMDEFGTSYSSGATATSNGTFNIVRFVGTSSPGIMRGTFSGVLKTTDGSGTVNITTGLFQTPLE